MPINRKALAILRTMLGADDVKTVENNATIADHVERVWKKKLDTLLAQLTDRILEATNRADGVLVLPKDIEEIFAAFFLEHEVATVNAASTTTKHPHIDHARAAKKKKKPRNTVKPKRTYAPRTAKQARDEWAEYKASGKLPAHAEVKGRKVQSLFVQKLQELWKQNTRDFVDGNARKKNGKWNPDAFDKEKARRAIQAATKKSASQARTIVETETTRYYNDARREFYDEIETVEGYLFAIVRDSATTKWCLSRGTKGGLVFFKGSALLEKNTPPCHWNCRSELLPLSRLNPTHLKLLLDEDRWAKNNKLVPLPPGWNA